MNVTRLVALFSLALPAGFAACSSTDSQIGRKDAPVDGAECQDPGEMQPAADGCNECTCSGGFWACTDVACNPPGDGGSASGSCEFEGVVYQSGESFECDCNTCFCEDGRIGSTFIGCTPGEPEPGSCAFGGVQHSSGDMFRCGDCEICFCVEGTVGTVDAACNLPPTGASCQFEGEAYEHGEIFDCDCNVCWCDDGHVGGNVRACSTPSEGQSCEYDGAVYPHGETFPCTDGCNICSCNDGLISSTAALCSPGDCTYQGVRYAHGESFPAGDGCNQCDCADGLVSCTDAACAPCSLPAESGPCFAAMTRFYFDADLGRCEPFTYGGCQGNANNFVTLAECEAACWLE